MTFNELNLSAPLLRAVADAGYTEPSPIQAKAIPPVAAGRDLMGCAQTGTGKTAAFALPMLQRLAQAAPRKKGAIRALILTPTRELALQIGDSFAAYGKYLPLTYTVIFGGVGQAPQVAALQKGVDIVIACPGRLNDLIGQGYVRLEHLEIFVLDEADRMLDMGFVHDVKRVIAKLPARRQNLMFSATMPAEIEALAKGLLHEPAFVKVDPVSSTVDRIDQSLYFVEDKAAKRTLLPYLIKTLRPPVTNALVFSRTKHGADRIAKDLCKQGIPAAAIHGNKSQSARVAALEGFKAGKTRVLVATDIAARGIDISELAYVFNFDLPEVPETYVHRIGRTARAGADGCAVSFCAPEEREYLAGIEKLNRKRIPVRTACPGAAAPAVPEQAAAPARPAAPAGAQTLQPAAARPAGAARKEDGIMQDNEKRPAPEAGAALSASAKRRRRRRRRSAGEGQSVPAPAAAAAQPAAPAQAKKPGAPKGQPRAPRADAQPGFDPRFLTPGAAQTVRGAGAAQPRPERPAAAKQQPAAKAPAREKQPAKEKQPAPAREPQAASRRQPVQPARKPAAQGAKQPARPAKERAEDPGLLLISRRAPQQKFASFEEYMEAHGGATAPIEDYTGE